MITFDVVDDIINEVQYDTERVEIRMKELPKPPVETSSEESKDEDLEFAIYDDQITKEDSTPTLRRDFNVDDLITHDPNEKQFNVPKKNMRRAARLNADSETYNAEI